MADKKVILPESTDELIEKWLPVIEGTGKWEKVVDGMPKVESQNYELLATQLEILEQTELQEATVASNVAAYTPVLIPMVRRVTPSLIAPDLFGTQPMTGPSGMIFSLKSLYQGSKAEQDDTDSFVIVVMSALEDLGSDEAALAGDISASGDDSAGDPVEDAVGTIISMQGNTLLVKITSGAFVAGDMACYASTMTTDEGVAISAVYTATEQLAHHIFENFSGDLASGGGMSTAAGETLGTATKELGFEISSDTVTAKTRKLKTRWTIELEDDLRAVHGMNAEQLLSGFCGDEIVREMNREFINKVHTHAAATTDDNVTTGTWTYNAATGVQGRTENERYQSLANYISRASRRMAKSNLRGPANYLICTLPVLTALEGTGQFKGNGNVNPIAQPFAGTFQGMKVYVDMFPTVDDQEYILLGYKGDNVDAGFYYCPYIPLKVNKGYGEEDNIPRLFFSTRYGLGENPFGANNYFHKIIVDLSAV